MIPIQFRSVGRAGMAGAVVTAILTALATSGGVGGWAWAEPDPTLAKPCAVGAIQRLDPPFGLPGTFADPGKQLEHQGVYRRAPDGRVTLLTRELRAPNGIALTPDGRMLYVSNADAKTASWRVYPVRADGTLGKGRTFHDGRAFVRAKPDLGNPDGLKVDESGNVFGAGPGGIYVFAPDGTHLGTIETGSKTSNCAFGEDGRTLFVMAGSAIYRIQTTTKGAAFAGKTASNASP